MRYFKNTELAKLYNVSEKSIRNWIDATLQGKLQLQLHDESGRFYIANTSKNTLLLEPLVEKGKKYRNSRGFKVVRPTEEFYKLYSEKQILDIIANLEIHHEIPYQYNYFNGGAEHWDKYTQRLIDEGMPCIQANTLSQLGLDQPYLDTLLAEYEKVNIVDVGVGNAIPVRGLLEHLVNLGKMGQYIGIDISPDMLPRAKRNVKRWTQNKVDFEGHIRDINYDRFEDVLATASFGGDARKTTSIITLFGGTLCNLRDPDGALRIVHESMGKEDILICDNKLDSEASRRYFDFASDSKSAAPNFRGKAMLDLLSIENGFYSVEQFFDEQQKCRFSQVKLKVALSIAFSFKGTERFIDLNKGDRIILWRAWHQNALEIIRQFDDNNFDLLLASRSKNKEYLLLTSRIKTTL